MTRLTVTNIQCCSNQTLHYITVELQVPGLTFGEFSAKPSVHRQDDPVDIVRTHLLQRG